MDRDASSNARRFSSKATCFLAWMPHVFHLWTGWDASGKGFSRFTHWTPLASILSNLSAPTHRHPLQLCSGQVPSKRKTIRRVLREERIGSLGSLHPRSLSSIVKISNSSAQPSPPSALLGVKSLKNQARRWICALRNDCVGHVKSDTQN